MILNTVNKFIGSVSSDDLKKRNVITISCAYKGAVLKNYVYWCIRRKTDDVISYDIPPIDALKLFIPFDKDKDIVCPIHHRMSKNIPFCTRSCGIKYGDLCTIFRRSYIFDGYKWLRLKYHPWLSSKMILPSKFRLRDGIFLDEDFCTFETLEKYDIKFIKTNHNTRYENDYLYELKFTDRDRNACTVHLRVIIFVTPRGEFRYYNANDIITYMKNTKIYIIYKTIYFDYEHRCKEMNCHETELDYSDVDMYIYNYRQSSYLDHIIPIDIVNIIMSYLPSDMT